MLVLQKRLCGEDLMDGAVEAKVKDVRIDAKFFLDPRVRLPRPLLQIGQCVFPIKHQEDVTAKASLGLAMQFVAGGCGKAIVERDVL